jgi:hypothetical protein
MDTTAIEMAIITSAAAQVTATFHRTHPPGCGGAPPAAGVAGTLGGAVSSSAVVVVIVGAVICLIAYWVVRGARPAGTGSQPATAWRPTAFAEPRESSPSGAPRSWTPTELEADEPSEPLVPLPPPRRVRALVLLAIWVGLIGAVGAGLIGAVTFLLAHVVDKALG